MPNLIVIDRIAIGSGLTMAYNKLTSNAPTSPAGLIAVALAAQHSAYLWQLLPVPTSPAAIATLLLLLVLSLVATLHSIRGILYWIAQLLGFNRGLLAS
ncbi:hypothetical protein NC652_022512 [Populus alba x Populus x berolinensis]|nr:hypothetical protein NC652_022512 [Populus alba x Populus x berolinensis]